MFHKKLEKGINGIDFSSNIDNAQKSLLKVMNHRIEKHSALLNETQLNVSNTSEISIERENALNEASENNSCSSTIKVNSSISKHKCEMCNKRFQTSSQLTVHHRIHSKDKPFACDQCQMTFTQSSSLTTHKRTHSGEKPYACELCPNKFAQLSGLITHKRTHTGEKPYQCDMCPSKFTTSQHLTDHKRTHTGEKPYSCDLCPSKFAHSNSLTKIIFGWPMRI